MRDLTSTDIAGAAHAEMPDADLRREQVDPAEYADPSQLAREVGWETCGCGVSSPHCYCPGCNARLRAPHTAQEARWMVCHHYEPTPTDLRRFPEAFEA